MRKFCLFFILGACFCVVELVHSRDSERQLTYHEHTRTLKKGSKSSDSVVSGNIFDLISGNNSTNTTSMPSTTSSKASKSKTPKSKKNPKGSHKSSKSSVTLEPTLMMTTLTPTMAPKVSAPVKVPTTAKSPTATPKLAPVKAPTTVKSPTAMPTLSTPLPTLSSKKSKGSKASKKSKTSIKGDQSPAPMPQMNSAMPQSAIMRTSPATDGRGVPTSLALPSVPDSIASGAMTPASASSQPPVAAFNSSAAIPFNVPTPPISDGPALVPSTPFTSWLPGNITLPGSLNSASPSPTKPSPSPDPISSLSPAPTGRPNTPVTSVSTAVNASDLLRVEISIFVVTYVGSHSDSVTTEQLDQVSMVTFRFLDDYLKSAFQPLANEIQYDSIVGVRPDHFNEDIEFIMEGRFLNTTTHVPTTAELDSLVEDAFNEPYVETLLIMLENLPDGNPYSKTSSVLFRKGLLDNQSSSSNTSKVAGITSAFLAAFLVTGVVIAHRWGMCNFCSKFLITEKSTSFKPHQSESDQLVDTTSNASADDDPTECLKENDENLCRPIDDGMMDDSVDGDDMTVDQGSSLHDPLFHEASEPRKSHSRRSNV